MDTVSWLDVGSGDAWFATQLRVAVPPSSSMTCWDINYALDDIASFAESTEGMVMTAERPSGSFDGILMLDVIEHVEDDMGFLQSIIDGSLAKGGWVLVSVPAYQLLFTTHDEQLKHYRRYSPSQCRALLRSAGLEVKAQGGLFHSLLPIRSVEAVKERFGKPQLDRSGIGAWKGSSLATRAITSALDIDGSLALWLGTRSRLVLPGLSYWAYCTWAGPPGDS
jgi:hypothetical protein